MPGSDLDSTTAAELETLMREFPDWKDQHPEIYTQLNPPRYSKINRKARQDPNEIYISKRSTSFPNSTYQKSFKGHQQRPRSTKQPPQTPLDPCPPPMTFVTNQRADFVEKDLNARGKLIKREERYEPPCIPVEGTSKYMQDYPAHPVLPDIPRAKEPKQQTQKSTGKIDFNTTTKEHYKHWVPEPSLQFGELPTFTDSILYPNQGRWLQTTTGATFRGEKGERRDMILQSDGNIRLEGSHDMATTSKNAFKRIEGVMPAQKVCHNSELKIQHRSKFNPDTQFKRDFGGFGVSGQPQPPAPVEPPPSTIQLRFDNRTSFETEQRKEFQGIDIRKHPMAKSCKADNEEYRPPSVKFESESHQKRDFKPIDIKSAYVAPVKPKEEKRHRATQKLDDCTMNKHFFKRWEPQPPIRYGDFHESHTYVPPLSKFEGTTTTGDTYLGEPAPVPPCFFPKEQLGVTGGKVDFNTVYKSSFNQPNKIKGLTRHQATQLLHELRQRKEAMATGHFASNGIRAQ